MLDPQTNALMDSLVRPLLDSESRELDGKINKAAAWAVQAGVPGSGLAFFKRIAAYYDHYKDLAGAVWAAILRVLEEADVQPYPELAGDLKHKFDEYMAAPAQRTQSNMVALSQMGHGMPKETFDGVYEQTREKYHAEIDLQCRRVEAKRKRFEEGRLTMNITYNLTGDSPRVNINSTDYSINITNSKAIFRQLGEAIQSGISEEQLRAALFTKTQEMESAVKDKPRFLKLYSDFIALAANHMTIIGPFIPALTHFINP
jgi:hypothetical protein